MSKEFNAFDTKGSITIYDLNNDKYYSSDAIDADKGSLPASTFKILNSCIALEVGAIKSEEEIIKWDGKPKSFKGRLVKWWNADTNIKRAFKYSTIWFYEELSNRIDRDVYQEYLKKCSYGNLDLSEKGNDFWNYGSLKISPKNQIEFLKAFYREELPFSKSTYSLVKSMMLSKKTDDYTISSKTGWAVDDNIDIGWWIGYIETKDNTYFFATRISKGVKEKKPRFSALRKEISMSILRKMEVLK
jgi:beta-lactamase class D